MHDEPLPSQQHAYAGLRTLSEQEVHRRRETVFLICAGVFLGTLTMLNILGITRFIRLWDTGAQIGTTDIVFAVAVGVLPYPITFLCTDFISELFGRKRASRVVWIGFLLNVWVVTILWFGGSLPGFESQTPLASDAGAIVMADAKADGLDDTVRLRLEEALSESAPALEQEITEHIASFKLDSSGATATQIAELLRRTPEARAFLEVSPDRLSAASAASAERAASRQPAFFEVRTLAFGAVVASMIAYLIAQLVDVHVFHFWKRVTNGKHLWLRNNGSTLVSQLVDTTAVILITHFYAGALPIDQDGSLGLQLALFIATGYAFKLVSALADTVPFYIGSHYMARYLRLPPPTHTEPHSGTLAAEAGVG